MAAEEKFSGKHLAHALKDAAIAAAIALAITAPTIGLRTFITPQGLAIEQRWTWVAIAVASVFIGRMLLNLFVFPWLVTSKKIVFLPQILRVHMSRLSKFAIPTFVALAVLLPFIPLGSMVGVDFGIGELTVNNRRVLDIAILVLTYIMLGWGLNIVVGLAGLLDLGYVAFYAVGAYSYALIATTFGWSFWVCLPLAGLFAAFFGVILGFPVLRLRGDYLAIVTLAFGEMVRMVLINWHTFTGGPNGISGIPLPSFFGYSFSRFDDASIHNVLGLTYSPIHRFLWLYYIILLLALITNFITLRLRKLPIGRAWEALREDEIACRSLGINTTNTKLTAFAIGAMFGGFAGSFFATRQQFISPESFVFIESALILAIVVLGGMGSQVGVVIAAVVMIGGFELVREFLPPEFIEFRMLIFGLAMVFIMVWKPRGLISTRQATIKLNPEPDKQAAT